MYLVTDGHSIKVGFTTTTVAKRIAGLQTGNPRTIKPMVTIHGVDEVVEEDLHKAFSEHAVTGEWFHQAPLVEAMTDAGGWPELLRQHLGAGEWTVQLHRGGASA